MTHPIPVDALDSDIAILGKKGGGKSYTAKGIVERLLDLGRRVLVLDPLGVWAGLRTGADGESNGYPVAIFGGLRADLPLDPAAAEPLARIIATENLPAVIDLSDLSKMAQQAFLLKFLHELRRVNAEALTIVLEEADVFAPQNPQDGDSRQLHGEIDWIARRGRFKGFRLISITQRPARLSKDVLTQAATLVAHRLPSPQDREAVKAWVDGNGDRDKAKEVFDTLANLAVGEAWLYAPEQNILRRAKFPAIKTLDTSSTPKAGEKRIEPKTLAQVDVSGIRTALAATSQSAPVSRSKKGSEPSAEDLAAAENRGYVRGYELARKDSHSSSYRLGWHEAAKAIAAAAERELAREPDDIAVPPLQAAQAATARPPLTPPKSAPRPVATRPATAADLSTDALLRAALQVWPARMTWAGLAAMCGLKARGGSFNTRRRRLLDANQVVEAGGLVAVTNPPAVPEGVVPADLLEQNLPATSAEAFKIIRRSPGIKLDELARQLGVQPRGGSWNTRLSILRKNGLITEEGGGLRIQPSLEAL